MSIIGMTDIERQILTNQAVIMGFFHGTFLDRISSMNEIPMLVCIRAIK